MKKTGIIVSLALAAGVCFAEAKTNKADRAKFRAERRAKFAEKIRMMGGMVEDPKFYAGKALIYNAQHVAAPSNVAAVAGRITHDLKMNFVAKEGTLDGVGGDWKALREREGAAAIVIVADDLGDSPSLLVSPDEYWATINVAKLGEGLNEDGKKRFLAGRVTRQIFRAFALLGGSGRPLNESPSTIRNLREIDHAREALPMDTLQQLGYVLAEKGLAVKRTVPYQIAVKEGWAAAPTNDIQKAVWDEVHSVPKNPMKIEFDPKKGR